MTKLGIVPITLGRDLFSKREVQRILDNTLTGMARSIKKDFNVTTQTWGTRPKFTIKLDDRWARVIKTDSDVYKFVSGGTKPHKIAAKNAPMLVFKSGFRPKTRVKFIGSNKGRIYGATIKKKEVFHPGSKARKFATTIALKWMKLSPDVFQRAIDSVIEAR